MSLSKSITVAIAVAALLPQSLMARADHLLISELLVDSPGTQTDETSAEFIEIFNPTNQPVDLTNYYLSDYPDYFKLPAGNFAFGDRSEFLLRFPNGFVLPPNGTAVVTQNSATFFSELSSKFGGSAESFAAQPGSPILFEVKNTSATVPDMINLKAGQPRQNTLAMNAVGGFVMLFYWDGATDLVKDVDLVRWGSPSSAEAFKLKIAQMVDGPDEDTAWSVYAPDTGVIAYVPSGPVTVLRRVNADETGEGSSSGGNGITGHDESLERIQNTFASLPFPPVTPGTPNTSLFPANVEDWQVY